MKVMTIMGTRPEMIKMWSVIKKLDQSDFEHIMFILVRTILLN